MNTKAHYEAMEAESRRLVAASKRRDEMRAKERKDLPTAQDFVDLVAQEYQVSAKIALTWLQCAGLMEFKLPPAA